MTKTLPPLKERVLALDIPSPRYTSYPTAPHFHADCGTAELSSWLGDLGASEPISIYCHIPFCTKLCKYCGCHTFITKREDRVTTYLDALHKNIKLWADFIGRKQPVSHVHFGGGTPSLLSGEQFAAIIDTMRAYFDFLPDCEIAMEGDPRSLSHEKLTAYHAAGLGRVSLGVQDFNQTVLKAVNREQPAELTQNIVQWSREIGIPSINFDLMYGLPAQTLDSMTDTIAQAIEMRPDRIAFFGYAHVPWMKKYMDAIVYHLPNASERYDMAQTGAQMLIDAGYVRVGLDHFVLPHDSMARARDNKTVRRNFQGYTTDTARFIIGMGASAITSAPQGFAQIATDEKGFADMVERGELPIYRGVARSFDDQVRGHVIEHIMCFGHVDLAQVRAAFNLPADYFAADLPKLDYLIADDLLSLENDIISIDPEAYAVLRLASMAFDAYTVAGTPKRHSKTV